MSEHQYPSGELSKHGHSGERFGRDLPLELVRHSLRRQKRRSRQPAIRAPWNKYIGRSNKAILVAAHTTYHTINFLYMAARIMATTRLRKTFHYPTEDDSDPDELDEQDQESLIADIQARDSSTNDFYRRAFLPLPLLSLLLYVPSIFAPTSSRAVLVALLSLTSLAGSAYIIYYLPLAKEDVKGKRPVYKGDSRGPVERYIVVLNAALAAFLATVAVLSWRRALVDDFWRGILPGGLSIIICYLETRPLTSLLQPFSLSSCSPAVKCCPLISQHWSA